MQQRQSGRRDARALQQQLISLACRLAGPLLAPRLCASFQNHEFILISKVYLVKTNAQPLAGGGQFRAVTTPHKSLRILQPGLLCANLATPWNVAHVRRFLSWRGTAPWYALSSRPRF